MNITAYSTIVPYFSPYAWTPNTTNKFVKNRQQNWYVEDCLFRDSYKQLQMLLNSEKTKSFRMWLKLEHKTPATTALGRAIWSPPSGRCTSTSCLSCPWTSLCKQCRRLEAREYENSPATAFLAIVALEIWTMAIRKRAIRKAAGRQLTAS